MMEWVRKNKTLVAVLCTIVGLAIFAVLGVVIVKSYTLSIQNEGQRKEQDLTALYKESVNSLSTCIDKGRTAAQVTEEEFQKIKEILVETAAARYQNDSAATSALGGGQLISALQENYPTVDQRDWQNLQTLVVGCRGDFQDKQDRIQAYAADFNKWRVSDDIFNSSIKAQFPDKELALVEPDGTTLRGQDAYDRITRVVTVAEANTAFDSGLLGAQDLFGSK